MTTVKTIFITGATSGIGRATAVAAAAAGHQIIACGRREERLDELKEELESAAGIHTLVYDVRDNEAVTHAVAGLPEAFSQIDVLINNAGNAHGLSPIDEGDVTDWDAMIDSNVKGLLYVTRAVVPGMKQRGSGHIINVGSLAGREVYPQGNVYCASKHAVNALTRGMRMDLTPYGIKVSEVNPGLVHTEFSQVRFKGDTSRAEGVYRNYEPLLAHDIAQAVMFMIDVPPHVYIADMLILPAAQASSTQVRKEPL